LYEFLVETVWAQRLQVAVQADARRVAGQEVQIRAFLAQDFLEVFVDDCHENC
jgi:hypothetical protein